MRRIILLAVTAVLLGTGCGGGYYAITDPTTEKVYYTRKFSQVKRSGAVAFTDAKSGNYVTVQNSEIQRLKSKEYKEAIGAE